MGSQWANKCEIKQDLYKAQGKVPVHVLNTIYPKAKPLNQNDIEENEQDHGDKYCEAVKVKTGPDLKPIKQMLDMVWQQNTSTDMISISAESIFEISKLNPKANNSISNETQVNFKLPRERRQRNAAVASILEAIQRESSLVNEPEKSVTHRTEAHMKLLKPEDFIKNKAVETVKEIHGIVNITSADFKKNFEGVLKTEFKRFDSYKPSIMADLYYKRYLERSKLKEMLHHTFKLETEKLIKLNKIKEVESICLPQHRHLAMEDCLVCQVLCRKFVE